MKLEDVRNSLKLAGIDLPATATEADALAAIGKLKNQSGSAAKSDDEDESEVTKLRKRLDAMELARTTEQAGLIEGTVNSAISAGKITASQKDTYTSLLKADFTNTSKALAEMSGRTPVSQRRPGQPPMQVDATRNDWGFDKWSKEDPEGLRAMKGTDPEKYQNLLDAYTA